MLRVRSTKVRAHLRSQLVLKKEEICLLAVFAIYPRFESYVLASGSLQSSFQRGRGVDQKIKISARRSKEKDLNHRLVF
jgi:hypothetical protein